MVEREVLQIKLGDGCRGNGQTGLQLPSFLCMANVVFRCSSPENPFGRGREDGHFNSRGHKTNFSIGAAARQATNHGSRYAALEKDSRAMGLFFSRFRRVKFSEKIPTHPPYSMHSKLVGQFRGTRTVVVNHHVAHSRLHGFG